MKKNNQKKWSNICRFKNNAYLCTAFEKKVFLEKKPGEVAEWSIAAVLKTVVLRGTGGSNPSLSAIKGVNQVVARFTPFFTPKIRMNVVLY